MAAPDNPDELATSGRPIEAAAADEVYGQDFSTSAFDAENIAESTSMASSVYRFAYENGRRYHQYRDARYPIPNDDTEQQRENLKHVLMMELTNGKYFFAPIGDKPEKIIDLGTGTGIWAIEGQYSFGDRRCITVTNIPVVADQFPEADVWGVDQTPIQPSWVPPNLRFVVDNVEDDWLYGSDFDFVHIRQVMPVLKNGGRVLTNAYDNLKSGGWIEIQELGGHALCDDGTTPKDHQLEKFLDMCQEALAKFGGNFRVGNRLQESLEKAGFTSITCKTFKVPIGPWAKDKTLRLVGMYFRLIVRDLLAAMGARPFQALGISPEEIERFLDAVRQELQDGSIHSYFNYHFWTAQKPEQPIVCR